MIESDAGTRELQFLSHEPVDGERLSDRLAKGVPAPEDALRIALELGAALQRAHACGETHGGVSPAAVFLTSEGARLVKPEGVDPELAKPYRAPEQVQGLKADWRSDIFSYGAVLYELACGCQPFSGSGAKLDEAIVSRPAEALKSKVPVLAAMEGVIAECLRKDPEKRRQRVQNAVIELKLAGRAAARARLLSAGVYGAAKRVPRPPQDLQERRGPRRSAMALMAVVTVAALVTAAAMYFTRERSAGQVLRFRIPPPQPAGYCGVPSVSPDGRLVACAAPDGSGQPLLWVRALDDTKWASIDGSDGASAPFWSPDSRYLGFFAKGWLKRVPAPGDGSAGRPATLCETEGSGGGATWSTAGTILFAPGQEGGVARIPATGGKPQPVLTPNGEKNESAFLWPQFLPDGKHFVFFVQTDLPETSGAAVGTLDPPSYRFLFQSDSNAVYSPPAGGHGSRNGYLLFIENRNLRGQEFNTAKLERVGESVEVAPEIGLVSSVAEAPLSVSGNATLIYQKVGEPTRQLIWLDRSGKPIRTVGDPGKWGPPRISPDGRQAVAGKMSADDRNSELWLIAEDGTVSLLQSTPGVTQGMPIWSPDGSRVAYWSNRNGSFDLFVKPVTAGKEEVLFANPATKFPTDWTKDGKYILFGENGEGTREDIWSLSLEDKRASPVVQTIYAEGYGCVSPDGKWMAYQSDETGRNEVYVQPFDPRSAQTQRRVQVSSDGGELPRWASEGRELYFLSKGGHLMVAAARPSQGSFEFDSPTILIHVRPMRPYSNFYDVSADGQRFLFNAPLERTTPSKDMSDLMVMTNWTEKLK